MCGWMFGRSARPDGGGVAGPGGARSSSSHPARQPCRGVHTAKTAARSAELTGRAFPEFPSNQSPPNNQRQHSPCEHSRHSRMLSSIYSVVVCESSGALPHQARYSSQIYPHRVLLAQVPLHCSLLPSSRHPANLSMSNTRPIVSSAAPSVHQSLFPSLPMSDISGHHPTLLQAVRPDRNGTGTLFGAADCGRPPPTLPPPPPPPRPSDAARRDRPIKSACIRARPFPVKNCRRQYITARPSAQMPTNTLSHDTETSPLSDRGFIRERRPPSGGSTTVGPSARHPNTQCLPCSRRREACG